MRATVFWEVENVKKIHVGNITDDWNKVVAFNSPLTQLTENHHSNKLWHQ